MLRRPDSVGFRMVFLDLVLDRVFPNLDSCCGTLLSAVLHPKTYPGQPGGAKKEVRVPWR